MAISPMPAKPDEDPPTAPRPTRFSIRVEGSDATFSCRADQRVLEAMDGTCFGPGAGKRPDLKVGCRRGGCGVCRVRVLAGFFDTATMSAAFVNEQERREGYALACCIYPHSDLLLEPARKLRLSAEDGSGA